MKIIRRGRRMCRIVFQNRVGGVYYALSIASLYKDQGTKAGTEEDSTGKALHNLKDGYKFRLRYGSIEAKLYAGLYHGHG
jgi:hypothetical protein